MPKKKKQDIEEEDWTRLLCRAFGLWCSPPPPPSLLPPAQQLLVSGFAGMVGAAAASVPQLWFMLMRQKNTTTTTTTAGASLSSSSSSPPMTIPLDRAKAIEAEQTAQRKDIRSIILRQGLMAREVNRYVQGIKLPEPTTQTELRAIERYNEQLMLQRQQ